MNEQQYYSYTAINEFGKQISNHYLVANNESENDIINLLKQQNLLVIKIQKGKSFKLIIKEFFKQTLNDEDKITFCSHLYYLLKAGIPLLEALVDLKNDKNISKRLKVVLSKIIYLVSQNGFTLSKALQQLENQFDSIFIQLIKVGEESGELVEVLKSLNQSLIQNQQLKKQRKTLLVYPAITTIIIILVCLFLFNYVVPKLKIFIETMQFDLPIYSKILFAVAGFINDYFVFILASILLLVIAIYSMLKIPKIKVVIHKKLLKLPIFGDLLLNIDCLRFAENFKLLYSHGIFVLESMKLSQEVVSNLFIKNNLMLVRRRIENGVAIAKSFKEINEYYKGYKVFPTLLLRMLTIGEKTGELDKTLSNFVEAEQFNINNKINFLQNQIQPILTIILGLIVLWIIAAILLPLYDLLSQLQL